MSGPAPDAMVLLVRMAPDAHVWPEEVFDPALVLAAFDQPVAVVFADAGLAFLGLAPDAAPTPLMPRREWIDRLIEFGVTRIFAVTGAETASSLQAPAEQDAPVIWLSRTGLGHVLAEARHVLVD